MTHTSKPPGASPGSRSNQFPAASPLANANLFPKRARFGRLPFGQPGLAPVGLGPFLASTQWLILCVIVFFTAFSSPLHAQATNYLPGLICEITLPDGSTAARVDAVCNGHWQSPEQFDERLTSGQAIKLRWRGALNVKVAGSYKLGLFYSGKATVQLDGAPLISGSLSKPALRAMDKELSLGYHPMEIELESVAGPGQVQLLWSGPGFQWEPLNERYLVHDAGQHPNDDYERGRLLARGLRCAACHDADRGALARKPLAAPDLVSLKGNLDRSWLIDWLVEPVQPSKTTEELIDDEVQRRMPHLGLDRQSASDIAAALLEASKEPESFKPPRDYEGKSDKPKSKDKKAARNKPDAQEGRTLVLSRGCIACHALSSEELGQRDEDDEANYSDEARRDYLTYKLFFGGELSDIAAKRPSDFFSRWLAKPESISASHRMPQADLSDLEREDIALFLASLKSSSDKQSDREQRSTDEKNLKGDAERGARLISTHRCAACHVLPEKLAGKPTAKIKLTAASRWDSSCLESANVQQAIPGFHLTKGQRRALQAYWTQTAAAEPTNKSDSPFAAELLLAESNCFGCHARENHVGLMPRAMQVIQRERELAARLPAMLPPSLNGVGDKLHDSALAAAIARSDKPHRPWLDVRMPKYPFDAKQVNSILSALVDHDRMPKLDDVQKTPLADDIVTRAAAGRLVTSEGFGCQSCHQIGDQPSPTVALGARGTDLTMLGKRIRQSWFDRWVRNPIRIVPRMEMPAIQLPVHGVLNNDLNRQIDAVWEMLNTPEFRPPSPAPVRVVRKHNMPGQSEPAHVLTDVLETSSHTYLRPMIVGLQNRHNVLIDLERGELSKWWIGDTARELTRGKSWYWELGGQPLGAKFDSLLRFELIDSDGERWKPHAPEQFAVEFDELEHLESRVSIKARMHFALKDHQLTIPVRILVSPVTNESGSGVDIAYSWQAPNGKRVVIQTGSSDIAWQESTRGPWQMIDDRTKIEFTEWSQRYRFSKESGVSVSSESSSTPIDFAVRLWTTWPVDTFAEAAAAPSASLGGSATNAASSSVANAPADPIAINVVPGFAGIQLPLPRNEMPTALAWHQGKLIIGSLKGRVCIAQDSDGDGLADTWQPISDDVPAPYGIASSGQSIDVLAKYGLLRLTPSTGASSSMDTPWKMQVVADGWGYTADYHDWAVGLVRDADQNYLVALPCQQDDRSPSAARLRGTVQRLIPQTATSSDPRLYRLETVAAGQRFPMGMAMDRAGRLFATDNQGNYNPFNEVNHIQSGKRYGFINKLENKPGFNPPLESPAVNLPHPWTRSVNGICFLNTPEGAVGQNVFGPYEGHLVGCEYNGLSLIRMSLEEVAGTMQGAAYMLSGPVAEGQSTFEGPVVCSVSPRGELVVGNIHDSGWGGGQNTGSIVQLKPTGRWPLGIAEVRALPDGLRILFTGKVDAQAAGLASNYTIRSYRRISTPAYGGNDQEERQEAVLSAHTHSQDTAVDLTLNPLREDSVYEIRVGKLGEGTLFPDEAHYTMKKVPGHPDRSRDK